MTWYIIWGIAGNLALIGVIVVAFYYLGRFEVYLQQRKEDAERDLHH